MAYEYFRSKGTKRIWAADVWKSCIASKHSFFLWLGVQSKLLTKDKLQYLEIDRNCILCGHMAKTGRHLFFECFSTSYLWKSIRQWLGIRRSMLTLASALKWMKKEAPGTSWLSKVKRIVLASTVYYIWLARNMKIFADLSPHLDCMPGVFVFESFD
ncbi:uncharacterized protein LOC111381837 [Olea europaea var. sylvestris]|uniref:uncharacterized protein LOC111381837 n=1 Tax=Olea europaea var. sylvestris TaxID=158386 RepID=UPI000C1D36AA|nr:uncharacterized protein LOC111381837 [Olea europaea var. sylvestris]